MSGAGTGLANRSASLRDAVVDLALVVGRLSIIAQQTQTAFLVASEALRSDDRGERHRLATDLDGLAAGVAKDAQASFAELQAVLDRMAGDDGRG